MACKAIEPCPKFKPPCDATYDFIQFVIISTGYESNMLEESIPGSLKEFCDIHKCKLYLIRDNEGRIFTPNFRKDIFENKANKKQKNLANRVIGYQEADPRIGDESFVIFEMVCDEMSEPFNALKVLSDIQDLEHCRIWSTYHIDFATFRDEYGAVYCRFDAEAG